MKALVNNIFGTSKLNEIKDLSLRSLNVFQSKAHVKLKKSAIESEFLATSCQLTGAFTLGALFKLLDQKTPSDLKDLYLTFINIDGYEMKEKYHGKTTSNEALLDTVAEIGNKLGPRDIVARSDSHGFILVSPVSSIEQAIENAKDIRVAIRSKTKMKKITTTCSTWVMKMNGNELTNVLSRAQKIFEKATSMGGNKGFSYKPKNDEMATVSAVSLSPVESVFPKTSHIAKRTSEEVEFSATSCQVSGALNRKGLRQYFDEKTPSALEKLSAVYININDFKEIESNFSKYTSNKIIQKLVVEIFNLGGIDAVISRWNPSEFLLVFPSKNIRHTHNVARDIKLAIQNKLWVKDISLSCNTDVYEGNLNDLKLAGNQYEYNEPMLKLAAV